jgi:hypothetical protein
MENELKIKGPEIFYIARAVFPSSYRAIRFAMATSANNS